MPIIEKFSQIADNYDVFLVDQWGVLHNGFVGFPDAQDAIFELKKRGKTIIILSNSSRPYAATAKMLEGLGYPATYYDSIITSGTDFQDNILHRHHEFYQNLGKNCYVLSWEQDVTEGKHIALHDMPVQPVDTLDKADFILCAGINRQETLEYYHPLLQQAKKLNLPMACINPDKVSVAPDGSLQLCPGAIADLYETNYGGLVCWHGKPYSTVYQSAERIANRKIDKKFLAIGDSIHHDIQGIKNMGGDGLFITSGIAWQEMQLQNQYDAVSETVLEQFYQKHQIFADYAQNKLQW